MIELTCTFNEANPSNKVRKVEKTYLKYDS